MTAREAFATIGREIGQEAALYRSLARWMARRPDIPAGATPIGYAQLSAPMLWLWTFASGAEVVAVELLLRSIDARWAEVIRLPVLVLGVWGLLWMLGQLAASKVRPHLITDEQLLVRFGSRTWVRVPLESIAAIRSVQHHYDGVMKSLHHEDDLLLVGVSLRTNLEVVLDHPLDLETSQGDKTAQCVGLWVDHAQAASAQLRTMAERRT